MGVGVAGVANYVNTSSGTASDVVAYGGVGGPYEYCSFFTPYAWFAKGEPGAWYDPSDLTTLFQDSAGTTPMSAVGTVADQPVGLMLDKSKGLALGAELAANPYSVSGSNWSATVNTVSRVSGGTMTNGSVSSVASGVVGKSYLVTFTASGLSGATCFVTFGNTTNSTALSRRVAVSGNYRFIIVAADTAPLAFNPYEGTDFSITISNISVKQIAGNHAFQATDAKRPMLSSRVNLLTKTEDFSDGIWGTNNASLGGSAIAPDGTLTGKLIIANSTIGSHSFGELFTPSVAIYTTSAYFKAGGYNYAGLQIPFGGINAYAAFNLITGVVTLTGGGGTAAILSIGDGWYKCSLTATTISTSPSTAAFRVENDGTFGNWSGNGTSGIYIWHPDLRPTNSGALLPPYQRVNTASDYDTVGFPLYLKANGTSSAMSTNSIDFTATDKMTVVTGVRKLSDASAANIIELSASADVNQRTFYLRAPSSAFNDFMVGQRGTGYSETVVSGKVSPLSAVITTPLDTVGSPYTKISFNGAFASQSLVAPGISTFGNYPLYLFARAGTSLWFNGQFYGAIIRGAQSDTASVTQTENYMATKTGITF